MQKYKEIFWSLINALGVFFYVMAVAWVLMNGERIFGQMQKFWGSVTFLLLFVFSALVVGLLVFGRPVYLWLNNFKKEAVRMLLFTAADLFIITAAALLANVLIK